jgi:hypothetical protein
MRFKNYGGIPDENIIEIIIHYRTQLSLRKHKRQVLQTGQSLARPDQLVTCFSLTSTQETLGENRGSRI